MNKFMFDSIASEFQSMRVSILLETYCDLKLLRDVEKKSCSVLFYIYKL